MLQPHLTNS